MVVVSIKVSLMTRVLRVRLQSDRQRRALSLPGSLQGRKASEAISREVKVGVRLMTCAVAEVLRLAGLLVCEA